MNEIIQSLRYLTHGRLIVVAVSVAAMALSIHLLLFVDRYATELLFTDQWDTLDLFFKGNPAVVDLFIFKFGPHREGVGLIAEKFIFPLTHWSSRFESFELAGILILAMLLALQLKRRLFGRLDYSDAVIPLLVLPLTQYENLIGPLNPAHSIVPLLLVIVYCLALTLDSPVRRYALVLVINFLMIFTGFAIFMGAVTTGIFVIACYRQRYERESLPLAVPLAGLAISSLSLGSFFVHYIFEPFVGCFKFPWPQPWDYLRFMAGMFSAATNVQPRAEPLATLQVVVSVGLLSATSLVAVVFAWRAARAEVPGRAPMVIAALAGFSLLYSAHAAVGRVCLGLGASQASRYSTLLTPAFLAIYFALCTLSTRRLRSVLTAVLALCFVHANNVDPGAPMLADAKRSWAACYKRTEDISYCDTSTHFQVHPAPAETHLKQKLDYLKVNHLNLYRD
jgi:hypothetical protein